VNPVVWVLSLYHFMLFMALTIFFEYRAGRVPKETGRWLAIIAGNFLWLPMVDSNGDDGWFGAFWIYAGALVPSFGLKFLILSFVGFARDRKKKQLEPDM
jgi:hypothetical protein